MRLSERPLDFDFILKQLQRAPDALMPYRKEVAALLLFGSASRDEVTPLSDIDLAVLYREGLSEWEMFKIHSNLYLDLSRLMHTDDFDLVNLNVAPLTLQFSAIEDKVILVLYDPQALVDFQAKVLGAYLDFYPILREYYKRLIGASEEPSMDIKLMNQIELLQEYISRLEKIRQKPIEEYLRDETLQAATERYLQIAIETCINIGNRLLSLHQFKGNFKAPKTY
ncbi:MAG: HepT-like ribonuclease domain-containing protein, partial [Acetomicrobium sp.]